MKYELIYYTVEDFNDGFSDAYDMKGNFYLEDKWELEMAAQDCANDFWSNHDGWECSWPMNFTLYAPDGVALGTFEIEQEVEPVFSARRVEEEEE